MNNQVKALYIDTLKKESRSKTLYFALAFSTISILIGYSIIKMFTQNNVELAGANGTMAVNLMMSFLNIWSLIITVFFGVNSIQSDFQEKIIYQYLSFPISRTTYFLVRLFGTWSIVFGFYLYSYLLTFLLFSTVLKISFTSGHLISILLMGVYTFCYVIISFLASLFLEKLGSFISLIFLAAFISQANTSISYLSYKEYFTDFGVMKLVFSFFHLFFPHLGTLSDVSGAILKGVHLELNYPLEIIHFVLSTMLLFYVAERIVRKKDF